MLENRICTETRVHNAYWVETISSWYQYVTVFVLRSDSMLSGTAGSFVADQVSQRYELVLNGCWEERREKAALSRAGQGRAGPL